MQQWALNECLRQLIKVYSFAEQQYIHSAVKSHAALLKVFFEQRAFERSLFIEEIEDSIATVQGSVRTPKKLEDLYEWHRSLYGRNVLRNILITDMESMIIDEKGLEICRFLIMGEPPSHVLTLLKGQISKLESGILSMVYLKALYDGEE
ncbi:MAG: hypothetical protein V7724_18665 [Sediminicola sp.]|mgnify:CR=1 FL=1|tara:strand:+ start:43608 stop:44057 length:450 start_codon:yes stop_codon:yes gene_type:complete